MTTELENEQQEQEVQYTQGDKPKEYTKTVWKNEETKLNEDNLNAIEEAIEENNRAAIANYFNAKANHQDIEKQKAIHAEEINELHDIIEDLFQSDDTQAYIDENGIVTFSFGSDENKYKRLISFALKSELFSTDKIITDLQKKAINSGITEEIKKSILDHIADKTNPHDITTSEIGAVALKDVKQEIEDINQDNESKVKVPSIVLLDKILKTFVSTAQQMLTEEQKEQVRNNIGASKNVGVDFIKDFKGNASLDGIGNTSQMLFAKGFYIIPNNVDNHIEIKVDFATAEIAQDNKTRLLKIVSNYGMIIENNIGDVLYIPSIPTKTNRIRVVNNGHRFNEENQYEEIAYLSDISSEINKLSILSYEFVDSTSDIDKTKTNVIWMVKKADKPNDPFDEYIIKNGEIKFIGTSLPSLEGYATQEWVEEYLGGQDVIKKFDELVGDIVSTKLENYVTKDTLGKYPTKTEVNLNFAQMNESTRNNISDAKDAMKQWTKDQKYLQEKDLPTNHYIVPDGGIPNSDMLYSYIILNGQRVYLGEQFNLTQPKAVSLNIIPTENGYNIYSGYEGDEELTLRGTITNGSNGESVKSYRCKDDYLPTSSTTRIDKANFKDNIDDITIGSLIIANKNECNLYHVTNIIRDDNTHNIIYVNVEYCMSIKGDQGIQGIQGLQGIQGEPGQSIKGEDGKRGSLLGIVNSASTWTETSTSQNYSYYTGNDMMEINDCIINTYYGYVYKCVTAGVGVNSKWQYKGSIRGPQGEQGPRGETGKDASQIPGYGAHYEIEEQLEEFLYKYAVTSIFMLDITNKDFKDADVGFSIHKKDNSRIDIPISVNSSTLDNIFGGHIYSTLTEAFDEIAKQYTGELKYFSNLKLSDIKAIMFRVYHNCFDAEYYNYEYDVFPNYNALIPIFGHNDYYNVDNTIDYVNISNHQNILGYRLYEIINQLQDKFNSQYRDFRRLFGYIIIDHNMNNGRWSITNTYNKIKGLPSSFTDTLYVFKNHEDNNILLPSTYITEDDKLTIIDKTRGEKLNLKLGEIYNSSLSAKFIGFYNTDCFEPTTTANSNDITKTFELSTFGYGMTDWETNIESFDYRNKGLSGVILDLTENGKYIINPDGTGNYWNNFPYFAINFGSVMTKKRRLVLNGTFSELNSVIAYETGMYLEALQNGFGITFDPSEGSQVNTEIKGGNYHDNKMILFSGKTSSSNASLQINVTDTEIEFKVVY